MTSEAEGSRKKRQLEEEEHVFELKLGSLPCFMIEEEGGAIWCVWTWCWKEQCGNFDREKELWWWFVGLLAFSDGVRVEEDHTHELPHVRYMALSKLAPSCALPVR